MNKRMGERGQVLPFFGICLMVLMGVGALAVDLTYIDYQQMRMQSAADAAAVAGAQQLVTHGCPDQSDAKTAAQNDSQVDNFTPSGSVLVQVDNPPTITDGPYQGDNCAVYVNIKVPQTTTWFLRLFNAPSGMAVSTTAVAEMQTSNPGCIYLLSPGLSSSFAGANISAPNCSILLNDTASFASATIKAQSIGYAGPAPSGGTFPVAAPTPMIQSQNPCPEIAGCAAIVASPPSVSGCTALSQTGGAISAGCYSSLSLSGAVTLNPGTYVINGALSFNPGTTLTGTGVTLYVTASGTGLDFSPIAAGSSLSPPSSGSYSNVLYYQVPGNAINPKFTGGLTNISGLIYAPGATNAQYCCTTGNVVLVFGGATFSSAVGQAANAVTIPNSSNIVRRVVIVE
ncbi:MAG: pilus assembly protein TadG-related protein [Candidatus Cybelea sp.]